MRPVNRPRQIFLNISKSFITENDFILISDIAVLQSSGSYNMLLNSMSTYSGEDHRVFGD
jgi:hypothetical protein